MTYFLEGSKDEHYKICTFILTSSYLKYIYFNTLYVTNYGLEESPLFTFQYLN